MAFGDTTKKTISTTLTSSAIILGVFGLMGTNNEGDEQKLAKSIANKINKVLGNPNARVKQVQTDSKKGSLNKLDGNSASSYTTYHSSAWSYCEEWMGGESTNGVCARWLDPYVSSHGFADSDKSALEGAMANFYSQMRENKSEDSWGVFNIKGNGQDPVAHIDDPNRLNLNALTEFSLKPEVQKEIEKLGMGTAMENLVDGIDKNEPVETMPNNEALRALANSYTQAFRNNLVAMLGGQRRMKTGIEIPGAENMVECEAFLNNADELQIKNYNQGNLSLLTPQDQEGVQKRIALCRQMMEKSAQDVNPVVRDGQIVSGDAAGENVDEAKTRLNLLAVDDITADIGSAPKPESLNLGQEQLASKMYINRDGNEEVVYETPEEQIKGYNEMLKKSASAQAAISQMTIGHIPDTSSNIMQNQIQGSVSAMEMNDLTWAQKKRLENEKVSAAADKTPPMTPSALINMGQ